MKTFWVITLYVLAVVVISAIVSPVVYNLVQAADLNNHVFDWVQQKDFALYFRRTVMVVGLVLLPVMLRRIAATTWSDIGLSAEIEKSSRFFWGFVFAVISMFILAAITLGTGLREIRADAKIEKIIWTIVVCVMVGGLEEVFFRGIILKQLRQRIHVVWALFLSSLFYAAIHFLKPAADVGNVEIAWTAGFELIPQSFENFLHPQAVLYDFASLFLAGMVLGYSFLKKGSIYFCIGLHAGWIFTLQTTKILTDSTENISRPWLAGDEIYDGVYGIMILLVFWGVMAIYENRRGNQNQF
ncbi:MAG: CPBP family intramembrane glutamic endopeptidase [Verrucomicrobiota bacterium]|nr:CPBP family intramembrane glutamic endopeptidase [Verrucomicrobiota bacterium]